MTTKTVVVLSSDGVKFSVDLFGRSDAQIKAAWEQEQRYAARKTAGELMAHGDFHLYHERVPVVSTDTTVIDEVSELRSRRCPPQLRVIQGGKAA